MKENLKPLIVFSSTEEFKHKCLVHSSANGWMNEELTVQWVKNVVGKFYFFRRLLAWDAFAAHLTDNVRGDTLKAANIDDLIIAGRCTKYIQAPDLV